VANKYPVAYRRGSAAQPTRLSTVGGPAASAQTDFNMERLFWDHMQKRSPIPSDYAREGKTVPRRMGSVPASALKQVGRSHPAVSALRALYYHLDNPSPWKRNNEHVQHMVPGWFHDQTCNPVEASCVLNWNDQRLGLHAVPACIGAQAVGPAFVLPGGWAFLTPGFNFGLWVSRGNCFNYNPVKGWAPLPVAQANAIIAKGHPWTQRGMRHWDWSSDPFAVRISTATHPHLNPGGLNVGQTHAQPLPIPYSVIPLRRTDESAAPRERTEIDRKPELGVQTDPLRQLPVAAQRRPGKGERERKVQVSRFILQAVSQVTEGLDFIKAMYPCLPKAIRAANESKFYRGLRGDRVRRGKVVGQRGKRTKIVGPRTKYTPADKAKLLYQHLDKMDIGCAMFNFIWDQVEDAAYAAISKNSKSPYPTPNSIGGGRSLQLSRQGDADLPHGQLPTEDLKKWLRSQLGV